MKHLSARNKKLLIAVPLGMFALLAVFLLTTYISIVSNFSHPTSLIDRHNGLTVLDRNGVVLFEFDRGEGPRDITPLDQISPFVVDATVATEDAEFWNNPGVNIKGFLRAVYENASFWDGGGILKGGGGSSITQQLAKNLYIPAPERAERSISRKVREAAIAFELNRRYSKEQILEWYLNSVYYGNGSYGVQAASFRYFNKPASDLTQTEAAMLAGIPRAPAVYDPLNNLEAAKGRQEQVLDLLVRHDYLTAEEGAGLKAQALVIREGRNPSSEEAARGEAPHLAVYVRDLLPQLIGDDARREGLRVTTSIDIEMQRIANATLQEKLASYRVGATNGALVSIDPTTGQVLAYVGSRDYFRDDISGQVDNVTALNQPGSTIKPLTYLSAFIKGWSPSTIVRDEPIKLSTGTNGSSYTLPNADGRYRGDIPVRTALGSSLNPPAVKALEYAGLENVYNNSRKLGLTTLKELGNYGPAFTLGGADVTLLDLTYAFSVFANGGEQAGMGSVLDLPSGSRPLDPIVVLAVEDSKGDKVWEAKQRKERVAPADHSYILTHVLSDDTARQSMFGLNSSLKLAGREAAVKSGLTDNARDAWTIGYTPQLVTGVWVGNANNSPMTGATSSGTAAPIWNAFMTAALKNQPAVEFKVPEGVRFVQICQTTGQQASSGCGKTVTEVFASGRAPGGAPRVQASEPTTAPRVQPTQAPRVQPTSRPQSQPTAAPRNTQPDQADLPRTSPNSGRGNSNGNGDGDENQRGRNDD